MPGKGTTRRSIRVPDAKWDKAKAKAEKEGRTVSDVLSACLDKYIGDEQQDGDGEVK
jgi:Mn-dependent DtxR family transcriptional regulator